MTLLRALVAFLLVLAQPAFGATRAGAPAKFSIPFGNSAGSLYITYPTPTNSQIGIKCGAASLTDGFPPLTMQAASAGGCPPLGQDFNGILKQITQWNQQTSSGAAPLYDGSFSASIGGYPEGAILSQSSNPSCVWISQVDNNSSNPDTGGANWTDSCPGGGISTASSTGSANAQVIAASPFKQQAGSILCWKPGFSNTGPLQINANGLGLTNVYQLTTGGVLALTGGEVHIGTMACAGFDGTQYELFNSSATASLVQADQTLSGGANVTSLNLGSGSGGGTVTLDCGARPLQYITNAGAFTIAAPANDGSCLVLVTNGGSAGTISFSGFTVNSGAGAVLDTTNGHKFTLSIWRINGTAGYQATAMQ